MDRPSHADGSLQGITDPEDPLRIDALIPDGPEQYIAWFRQLSERRRVG